MNDGELESYSSDSRYLKNIESKSEECCALRKQTDTY